jgi:predicted DNA-binding transcriptional regulator AlpA
MLSDTYREPCKETIMRKQLLTLEEIAQLTHWGTHGAYFNSKQYGFPSPVTNTGETPMYDYAEVIAWDRSRPVGPTTEVIVIRSVN